MRKGSAEIARAIRAIQKTPLPDLGSIFHALAEKTLSHRLANKGFVPLEVFPNMLSLAGAIPVVELVIEVRGQNGRNRRYALKKRDGDVDQWKGYWHLAGTVARLTDSWKAVFERLSTEVYGSRRALPRHALSFAGIALNYEKHRRVSQWSIFYHLRVNEKEIQRFAGTWTVCAPGERLSRIVPYHRSILGKFARSKQPFELMLTKPPRAHVPRARRRGRPKSSGR